MKLISTITDKNGLTFSRSMFINEEFSIGIYLNKLIEKFNTYNIRLHII